MLSESRQVAVRVGRRKNRRARGSREYANRFGRKRYQPDARRGKRGTEPVIPSSSAEIQVVIPAGTPSAAMRALLEKGYSVSVRIEPAAAGDTIVARPETAHD